jgi:hypothetical protein
MWLKLAKIEQKWIFFYFFRKVSFLNVIVLKLSEKHENSRKSLKIGQLLPILATFYEFKSHFEKSW